MYFTADDGAHGYELWSTDGTAGNTKLVKDINNKSTGSFPNDDPTFFINGSYVLFSAYNADSTLGLYKLTSSGVSLVNNTFGDSVSIELGAGISATAFGNKTVFTVEKGEFLTGSSQLWITDGTNTTLLKDFGAGSFELVITSPFAFNGKVLFGGYDSTHGNELWTTDGTPANTKFLKDLNTGSQPSSPFLGYGLILNNKLLFTASPNAAGNELWSTDGSAANTVIVKDIYPGSNDADISFLFDEGIIQKDFATGNFANFSIQNFFTIFKGKIYFTANDGTHGNELWSSDGTLAGTAIVKDINPGSADGTANAFNTFYTTSGIYFEATNGTTGFEPWVTDGTLTGTKIVDDVVSGSAGSNPFYDFIYKNQLYFTTENNDGDNLDLYKIDAPLTILPVTLSSFAASLQPSSVLLNWQTANEINADHFGVERSVDGGHFTNIDNVAAKGNSSSTQFYVYNDYDALHISSSTLYYRLKTIDKDGKYTYSSIIKLQLHNDVFSYSLSPNPVRSQLTVNFTTDNATKQASLKITDASGKPVYEKSLQGLQPGSVQQYINVAGLATGVYYVQLITDNGTKSLKFVKQ